MKFVAEFTGTDLNFHFAPKKSRKEKEKEEEKEEVREQLELKPVRAWRGDSL